MLRRLSLNIRSQFLIGSPPGGDRKDSYHLGNKNNNKHYFTAMTPTSLDLACFLCKDKHHLTDFSEQPCDTLTISVSRGRGGGG